MWEQNFLALQLPESRFDGIFANASLFHVPSQELPRVLRNCMQPSNRAAFCSARTRTAIMRKAGIMGVTASITISKPGVDSCGRRDFSNSLTIIALQGCRANGNPGSRRVWRK